MTTTTGAIEAHFHGLHVTKYDDGRTHVELADLPIPSERDMGSLVDLVAYLGARHEEYLDGRARPLLHDLLLVITERRDRATALASWFALFVDRYYPELEDALADNGKPVEADFDEDREP